MRANSQHKINMILRTQFTSKNYAEKFSSTLLTNASSRVRHIKFSRVRPTKYQLFVFALLIITVVFKAQFSMWPNS